MSNPSSYKSQLRIQALLSSNTSLQPLEIAQADNVLPAQLAQAYGQHKEPHHPYRAAVHVPNPGSYDYTTLTTFQSALTASILTRHAIGLRHLHLSIWALTVPIAHALAHLPALQNLSITITRCPYIRAVPRPCIISLRDEEQKAWNVLGRHSGKNTRLRSLKIEDAELDIRQLLGLLQWLPSCKALSLKKCNFIGRELWHALESGWEGWARLEDLGVSACGGILGEATLDVICRMKNLKHLDLYDCVGLSHDTVEDWNKNLWHISEVIPPKNRNHLEDGIIEVDPAYID